MSKILLENGDRLLQEDGSFLVLNEDILTSADVSVLAASQEQPVIEVGVTVSVGVNQITSSVEPPAITLGVTVSLAESSLTTSIQQPSISYGVSLTQQAVESLVAIGAARARLVVGCWEIPFEISSGWSERTKPNVTFQTRTKPSSSWSERADVGDNLLLEDGFKLLLENGDKIKIGQAFTGRVGVETGWSERTKPTC